MTRKNWYQICTTVCDLALCGQTITAIKIIRSWTGCGLIEARDAVWRLMNNR